MGMQAHIVLRPAVPSDAKSLYAISLHAHQAEYSQYIDSDQAPAFNRDYSDSPENLYKYEQRLARYIQGDTGDVLLAEDTRTPAKKVVGFIFFRYEPSHTEIRGLYVDPAYQGQGTGGALLTAAAARAHHIRATKGEIKPVPIALTVLEKNSGARRLYEKHGFQLAGDASKTYYGARLLKMVRSASA